MERRFTRPCAFSVSFKHSLMLYHLGMSHLSTSLRSESEKYRKAARNINIQAMIRQYAPVAAVVFIFLMLLVWRFW
jgi:hypothetical protein